MALQLSQQIDNLGVDGNYHRINAFTPLECFPDKTLSSEAHLYQYISQDTREGHKAPYGAYKIKLGDDFWNQLVGDEKLVDLLKRLAYSHLKSQALTESEKPEEEQDKELVKWVNAIDC